MWNPKARRSPQDGYRPTLSSAKIRMKFWRRNVTIFPWFFLLVTFDIWKCSLGFLEHAPWSKLGVKQPPLCFMGSSSILEWGGFKHSLWGFCIFYGSIGDHDVLTMSYLVSHSGFGSCFLSQIIGVITTGCFGSPLALTWFGIRRRSHAAPTLAAMSTAAKAFFCIVLGVPGGRRNCPISIPILLILDGFRWIFPFQFHFSWF